MAGGQGIEASRVEPAETLRNLGTYRFQPHPLLLCVTVPNHDCKMSGQTIAQKILSDASGREEVEPGEHTICEVDGVHTHDHSTYDVIELFREYGIEEVADPSKIAIVLDHEAPPAGEDRGVVKANEDNVTRKFAREQGITEFYDYGSGISHNVLPEKGYVAPGKLLVGGDSHTTTFGAFGAAGTGMGRKDIAYVFATGEHWFRVPETIEFRVTGEFDDHVTEKDLVLQIIEEFGIDVGRYKSIEYRGEAIESLSIDGRVTLANMGIELGAKFAFGPVDDVVFDFIDEHCDQQYEPKFPDSDAEYLDSYEIRADDIVPKISKPHHQKNVGDVQDVQGTEVDMVFIGSCTNGQYQDMVDAAEILEGREIDPDVRMIVTPSTQGVSRRMAEDDIMQVLQDAGAIITHPTCGACAGTGPGVLGDDDVCLAAQNRNAKGRMGSETAEIYLSSPKTAAASAITGRITDPREV